MTLQKHRKTRRGFSLAELLIVVAIIGVLAGIAFVFINPKDIDYVEYNRSAEAIATAVQNRLTEIRNTGDMSTLRALGVQATSETGKTESTAAGSTDPKTTEGGYRYLFNYSVDADKNISKGTGMSYILPFGAIDSDIADGYFAVGFQSDTGMCGEVFYSPDPFVQCEATYLLTLKENEEQRKKENVGYYEGVVDDQEIAFANLPTPQLTITNYEELALQIHIPKVKQLEGKKLGLLISLTDEDGNAFKNGMTLAEAAIYSTFSLGGSVTSSGFKEDEPIIKSQTVSTDSTYTIILDTMKTCSPVESKKLTDTPTDKFENWARRSDATATEDNYDKDNEDNYFLLGDNSVVTVTVYCLLDSSDNNTQFPVDPTFMPRSASLTFNGWFNQYYNDDGKRTAEIACGRHLQNLNNLTEMRPSLAHYLPDAPKKDGVYVYGNYNYGMADAYTEGSSKASTTVSSDDVKEKYARKSYVKSISYARQINAIDFDSDGWKEDGKQIPFTPVNLSKDFRYYGNYLTISHLKVDAPFYAGLFGYVYHVRLYDILLVNPSVTSQAPAHLSELYEMGVGALVGTSRDSDHINNCQAYMTKEGETGKEVYKPDEYRVTGECYVGGLIGFCEDEHIANCSASVYTGYAQGATKKVAKKVTTGEEGIATAAEEETVVTEEVSASSHYVGGLIGCITGDSNLDNCYAAGNLSGEYVGGLVGYLVEDSDPSGDDYRIETCYTAGHIEYASEEAAGLVGRIHELMGNTKSAVSIYGNYCVIIYGVQSTTSGNYVWKDGAPIYGTFKGDGFEWISTNDFGYSDAYLKGEYAGITFSVGAVFKNDNKNYYIAQKGIHYSNSPYFEATQETLNELLKSIKDGSTLKTAVEKAQDKIFWMKKIQALEELKAAIEDAIYEMDNETGKDIKGNPYTDGGYSSHGAKVYLDKNDAEIVSSSSGNLQLTAQQALHAIYNGEYTDDKGTIQKIEITDQDHNKKDKNEEGAFDDFTFMGFYNALKKAYTDLIDGSDETKVKAAEATLKFVFGDNTKETYEEVDDKGEKEAYPFYQDGRFYRSFYYNMYYRLFDKCKDYYQLYIIADNDNKKEDPDDQDGTLLYYHFRDDFAEKSVRRLICDLGMSRQARDFITMEAKSDKIAKDIEKLKADLEIYKQWREDETKTDDKGNKTTTKHMKNDAKDATEKTQAAIDALESLKKFFDEKKKVFLDEDGWFQQTNESYYYTSTELTTLMDAAKKALNEVKDFFDGEDAYGEDQHRKDVVDYVGKDEKGNLKEGDMRNFRDAVAAYLRDVELCASATSSGIGGAIDELAAKINQEGANNSELVTEFKEKIETYLGDSWNSTDSGHNIENSEQLRNAARGYVNGVDTGNDEDRDGHLGFMYDYGNEKWTYHSDGRQDKDINPYTNSGLVKGDHYVDDEKTNNVFNNVFPYHESAYTHYYPFPFVFGLEVEGDDIPTTYVLFHYGDWLTQDLWADEKSIKVTNMLYEAYTDVKNAEQVMAELEKNKEKITTENTKDEITTLYNAVKTCVESVGKALQSSSSTTQKNELSSIRSTIQGWIATGGDFEKISNVLKDNQTEFKDLKTKFDDLKTTLTKLLSEIDAVVGDNVAKDGE